MKKILGIFLYSLAALLGGIAFAVLWVRVPALSVINLPEPTWLYLMDLFDAHCCESAHDLQVSVAIVFGTLVTGLLLVAIRLITTRWR